MRTVTEMLEERAHRDLVLDKWATITVTKCEEMRPSPAYEEPLRRYRLTMTVAAEYTCNYAEHHSAKEHATEQLTAAIFGDAREKVRDIVSALYNGAGRTDIANALVGLLEYMK